MTKHLLILIISILFFGCAAPRMNLSQVVTNEPSIQEDQSLVYFIRPSKVGYAVHSAVYDDSEFIGFVPYQQKLPYITKPGKHRFMVVSEAADFIDADLLPGKTYYIRVVPRMGFWRARFSLSAVTKRQHNGVAKDWIENARLIKNNSKAKQWANENSDSVKKKEAAYLKKWLSKEYRPVVMPEDHIEP
ncbi:MAG: hypothetical protein OCD01_17630 [Fibrobacterales bacterium]